VGIDWRKEVAEIIMSNIKKYIIVLCIFIVILVVMLIQIHIRSLNKSYYLKAEPPESVKNLSSYLDWKPETKTIFKADNNGRIYYFCLGERGRTLASGPSAYCFDSNFNFIGWSSDIGDLQGTLPQQAYEERYKWKETRIDELNK